MMDKQQIDLYLSDIPFTDTHINVDYDLRIHDSLDGESHVHNCRGFIEKSGVMQRPLKVKFMSLLICFSGYIRLRLNLQERYLRKGDMIFIHEDTVAECLDIDPETRVIVMSFSKQVSIAEHFTRPTSESIAVMMRFPVVHLNDEECADIKELYYILRRRLQSPGFVPKREMFMSILTTMFYYISEHAMEVFTEVPQHAKAPSRIFERFIGLVEKHCVGERSLPFYADKLCVTPKYLSRTVKEATGKSAKRWVDDMVILQAKVMLNQSHLTIQEISDRLGFPNQSFFGSFFKKSTGTSPSAYRLPRK